MEKLANGVGTLHTTSEHVVSITNNFLRITHTVEHNYTSPSSTVRIQLHFSTLYVGHLQVVM